MNHKPNSPPSERDPQLWGWELPQCRGQAALALFIDDLDRILQAYTTSKARSTHSLRHAQEQVDVLLSQYMKHAAAPNVFAGQSVDLREGVDHRGVSYTVPIFSPQLKQSLVSLLEQKTK